MSNITSIIIQKLLILPGILIGLSIHEFAHAFAAYKLGDQSQKFRGRLTIDPLKHIDPMGFLLLLVAGFGWAKPVQIDSRYFKNPKRDDIIVSMAGPVSNLLMAILISIITAIVFSLSIKGGVNTGGQVFITIVSILQYAISINLVLMVFNLIPIPPLDGHHVLADIGGYKVQQFYNKYNNYWSIILIVLIISGAFGFIIGPTVGIFNKILMNLMNGIVNVLTAI